MDINSSVKAAVDGQKIENGEVYRCKNKQGIYDYWLAIKSLNTDSEYPAAICVPINVGTLGKNSDPTATEIQIKNTSYNYIPDGRIYTETKAFLLRGRYVGTVDKLSVDYITNICLSVIWPELIEKINKLGEVQKDLETAATVNNDLIQQIDELKSDKEKENSKLKQAEYKAMFEEMKTIAGESKDPNKDLFDYIRDMKSCGDPEKIMSAITALKMRIKNASVKKADVQAIQADSNKRLDALEKKNSELQSQNDKLKNTVQQLTQQIESTKAEPVKSVVVADENTNNLKLENENLKGQIKVYESIIKKASIELETINKTEVVDKSVVQTIVQESLRNAFVSMFGNAINIQRPAKSAEHETTLLSESAPASSTSKRVGHSTKKIPMPKNFESSYIKIRTGKATRTEIALEFSVSNKTVAKWLIDYEKTNPSKVIKQQKTSVVRNYSPAKDMPSNFGELYPKLRRQQIHQVDVANKYSVTVGTVARWSSEYEKANPTKVIKQVMGAVASRR